MDLNELRKMTLPKLRELGKEIPDLQGVMRMKKEELISAIAKAKGISYQPPAKDIATISSIKQEIKALRKQKDELLASSQDHFRIKRMRKKIKKLKRLTRMLNRAAKPKVSAPPSPAPEGAQAASG